MASRASIFDMNFTRIGLGPEWKGTRRGPRPILPLIAGCALALACSSSPSEAAHTGTSNSGGMPSASAGAGGAFASAGSGGNGGSGALAGTSSGSGGDPDVSNLGPQPVTMLAQNDDFNAASDGALGQLGALYNLALGQWRTGPRWSWANDVESSLANYERSNGLLAPYLFTETYDLNLSKNFLDDFGYDDEAWWANAWIRTYDVTGDTKYLSMAKTIFADMLNAWDASTCNGGVWWNRNRDYKNAITNELFMLVAAQLHNRTAGDVDYLNWAKREWDWFKVDGGMIDAQGLIDDGLTAACKSNGQTQWTYNQGIVLGALVELYHATSDLQYLEAAQKLAAASTTKSVTAAGILQEPCEPSASCNDDQSNFKGIYQRHLLRLFDADTSATYGAFLFENAHSVLAHDRDASGNLGLTWSGPFDHPDAQRQNSGLQALHAAAPPWTRNLPFVRAAGGASFNHPMGRPVDPLAWRCDPASCPNAGSMQDGPFIAYLPAGAHVAHFELAASRTSTSSEALVQLEVRDETTSSTLALVRVAWSEFRVARSAQDFSVPFTLASPGHALSFRVLWQALAGAPALTIDSLSVDQPNAFAAANLTHECGRADAFQNWEADRQRDSASCALAAASGLALPAGHAIAHFELKVDNFGLDDANVATIAVLDHATGAVVLSKDLTRKSFPNVLFQDFSLEFSANSGQSFDFITTWQNSELAPRLTQRSIYVQAATADASITLPFDTRGIGTAPGDASVDGVGSALSAQWLGSAITVAGHSFAFGSSAPGALNVLASNGQNIALPPKAARELHLLLFAVNGTQSGVNFELHYTDHTSASISQSVSDWVASAPQADESYALAAPARWSKTALEYGNFHVFHHVLPLDSTRTLASLTVPTNPNLKILAATLSQVAGR